AFLHRATQISGKRQPLAAVPRQQFGKKYFVNGHPAGLQGSQLLLVVVHQDHFVAYVRKARPGHQANVTRSHYCNPHENAASEKVRMTPIRSPTLADFLSPARAGGTKYSERDFKLELRLRGDGRPRPFGRSE